MFVIVSAVGVVVVVVVVVVVSKYFVQLTEFWPFRFQIDLRSSSEA